MTLREKAGFVALGRGHGLENFTPAVKSLCLPSLTLTDGPDGLAGGVLGVTQLPAAIGIGASGPRTRSESGPGSTQWPGVRVLW